MEEPRVMVYLMTGFLDSGKTQFLKFTLEQDYFQIDGLTLLILCEEGEEEYDEKKLFLKSGVKVAHIDGQEELTEQKLQELELQYNPERVIIEYNGMWKVSDFESMRLPDGWGITQKLTMVDAETFDVYMANMKPLFVEMVRDADLVLFNRCQEIAPLAGYRRSVKVVSPQAEVIFENEDGEIDDIFEGSVPYDVDAPVIQIANEDYGIWYVDMMDHPERYKGKVVEITARAMKPKGFPPEFFMPGRKAMTCCAEDTSFIGYICKSENPDSWKVGEWLKIRAKVLYKRVKAYRGEGPVLYAISMEPAQPVPELVYFN
jgi:hypothetical protein